MKEFKQSGAGLIPMEWSAVQLKSIGKVKNGINKPKEAFGSGYPFVNLMDVFGIPSIRSDSDLGLLDTTANERRAYTLNEGDVLFVRSSVKPSGVGLATLIEQDLPDVVFSGFLLRFRDSGDLSKGFKKYCFASQRFREALIASSTASANTNINQKALGNLWLAVPPTLKEQEAIAKALSDADALIEGLERLIAKKRLIKQGAMQDLLTAKRRLPGFSGEWVETTFRKLLKGAPSYGINSAACPLGSGGYDYLRITDIDEHGHLRQDGRAEVLHPAATQYFLEPDDIVVVRTGASTGKSHRYEGPAGRTVYAGFLIKLAPEPASAVASFLFQFMQTDAYWSWITENSARSGQPGINGQQLSGMGLVIPPNVREQQAIALMLGDMDAEIQALETRLEKARQVKEGMMQNLLTGRIRLV